MDSSFAVVLFADSSEHTSLTVRLGGAQSVLLNGSRGPGHTFHVQTQHGHPTSDTQSRNWGSWDVLVSPSLG